MSRQLTEQSTCFVNSVSYFQMLAVQEVASQKFYKLF